MNENEILMEVLKPKPVLVLEDDPGTQKLFELLSVRMNIEIEFARNGVEGVELIKSRDWHFILIDIRMPKMDGFEVIEWIHAHKPGFVRYAAVSAFWDDAMLEKFRKLGGVIVVLKPDDYFGGLLENDNVIEQLLAAFGVDKKRDYKHLECASVETLPNTTSDEHRD